MPEIQEFSPEVVEQLKFYVYRLIDPRNGKTFYVGKGQRNRVFEHTKQALKLTKEEDAGDLKYKTIQAIKDAGLEVIHIIQRYGMSEEEAFAVEAALIDIFGIENLTNKQSGYNTECGVCNAITLQRDLSAESFKEDETTPKFIIIKTNETWISRRGDNRYEATRSAWKLNPQKANQYPYVLSVTNGIVKEVYEVDKWVKCPTREDRYEFNGKEAPKSIRDLFVNKRIPESYRKKGQASPFLYSK
ncbi:hypothetical protein LS70_005045 [Helicobacter sp. MIT 11-5569]|uniref:LEM-3-like GIY-YIG domain-containing protein n=1 Tax=Helicobacter sp. MIT 11-5569 TaxID=1548151 RepID=UPI00051F9C54|nr:hypothetical protein [Helicobacter sp. MIT 11-5569]TLD83524.1 hypothetical protein LS70_005045 [Helicobacter sp. MIT 11-5569]